MAGCASCLLLPHLLRVVQAEGPCPIHCNSMNLQASYRGQGMSRQVSFLPIRVMWLCGHVGNDLASQNLASSMQPFLVPEK